MPKGLPKIVAIHLEKAKESEVVNAGCLKAGDVCKRVQPVVKSVCGKERCFNASYHHAVACEFYKVRPKRGDPHPEKTNVEMCQYDAAHKDFVFTEKWVAFLIEEMKKPGQYQKLLEFRRTTTK